MQRSEPLQLSLILPEDNSVGRYAHALAKAGLFSPYHTDDERRVTGKEGHVSRKYVVSNDLIIHHEGPALSLQEESTYIATVILNTRGVLQTYTEDDVLNMHQSIQFFNQITQKRITQAKKALHHGKSDLFEEDDLPVVSGWTAEISLQGEMSYKQINGELGLSHGTTQKQARIKSLSKLERTQIAIEDKNGRGPFQHLISVDHSKPSTSGRFTVSHPGTLFQLFCNAILIDLTLRQQLSDMGKHLLRHLCLEGFPNRKEPWQINMTELQKNIAPKNSFSQIRHNLEKGASSRKAVSSRKTKEDSGSLNTLKRDGIIGGWEFINTNKSRKMQFLRVYPPAFFK